MVRWPKRLPAQSVADIVKTYAERVELNPALFAGHSMRSGFLTSAAKRGASIFKMMDQSRHRSLARWQKAAPAKPLALGPRILGRGSPTVKPSPKPARRLIREVRADFALTGSL